MSTLRYWMLSRTSLLSVGKSEPVVPSQRMARPTPVATPETVHARAVYHLGQLYFVVFKDQTFEYITDVWTRDLRAEGQRRCIWSHRTKIPPTQRVKNICIKVLLQETYGKSPVDFRSRPLTVNFGPHE